MIERLTAWLVAGVVGSCVFSATSFGQTTIYVDKSNPGCPGSGTEADPFCLIQDGIDAASDGNTVVVRSGTYLENINMRGKRVTLLSFKGADETIIDGQARAPVILCESGETSETIVQGFTLQNGIGKRHPPYDRLGGGGVHAWDAALSLIDCKVLNNVGGDGSGGGALFGGRDRLAVARGCVFEGNSSAYGAGLHVFIGARAHIENCRLSYNRATKDGGGLTLNDESLAVVVGCLMTGNRADRRAGGLQLDNTHGTIVNCTISGNTTGSGGGVWAFDNQQSKILNSIIWGNSPQEIRFDSGTLDVQHSDVRGGWPGTGNIQLDPQFIDAASGDFRLACTSPCVDTGTNATGLPMPRFDLSGLDNRIIGTLDVGADELGVDWTLQGTVGPGTLASFSARASSEHPPFMVGEVYLSLGDGSIGGGIPVPLAGGRRLGLEVDSLLAAWLSLSAFRQVTTLNGCSGASTLPFTIPPTAPVGVQFYYAGVAWDLATSDVTSISETKKAVTQQ
ncbi:MAG: right-handed parallel beta-helix repeat-containing protein [Planctomycetota bacterium]